MSAEETYPFEHGSKVYKVSRLTQAKKKEFSRQMKQRALRVVLSLKDVVSDDEYTASYNAALERVASGAFDFHSPFTQAALKTPGGVMTLSAILFGCTEDEMEQLFRERQPDVKMTLDLALKDSAIQTPDPTEAD